MSRFFSPRHAALEPYVPGEQPRDQVYIKLNTNESPFPPSPKAAEMAARAAQRLQLYSDPECRDLKEAFERVFGISGDKVLFTNGSDEALYFLFLAFCDEERGAAFPALSYGFYPVYADFTHTPALQIPLREDFTIDPADYGAEGLDLSVGMDEVRLTVPVPSMLPDLMDLNVSGISDLLAAAGVEDLPPAAAACLGPGFASAFRAAIREGTARDLLTSYLALGEEGVAELLAEYADQIPEGFLPDPEEVAAQRRAALELLAGAGQGP